MQEQSDGMLCCCGNSLISKTNYYCIVIVQTVHAT
jgi:hypothetical protein